MILSPNNNNKHRETQNENKTDFLNVRPIGNQLVYLTQISFEEVWKWLRRTSVL